MHGWACLCGKVASPHLHTFIKHTTFTELLTLLKEDFQQFSWRRVGARGMQGPSASCLHVSSFAVCWDRNELEVSDKATCHGPAALGGCQTPSGADQMAATPSGAEVHKATLSPQSFISNTNEPGDKWANSNVQLALDAEEQCWQQVYCTQSWWEAET